MRTNLFRVIVGAALVLVASIAPSGAIESRELPNDVELLPARIFFNTSSDDATQIPNGGRSASGPDKDKGKKNGKPHEEEEQGSGGQESGSGGSGSGGDQTENCWTWGRNELEFFEKINNARTNRGRQQVKLDAELSWVAGRHAYNMKRLQRLYHTPEENLRERVTNWEILGENVGRGGSVESLHRAFMESDSHRDVVLHPAFNHVGVGVAQDGDILWVTILFEAYQDPGTTMEMPATC